MNKTFFLLLVFASSIHASVLLSLDLDRSGSASVILSLEGETASSIQLPQDASNFRIVGGSYEIVNRTAIISSRSSGFATFSFSSAWLTTKTASGWRLHIRPPDGSDLVIYMPSYAVVQDSSPQPARVSADDSRTTLEFNSPEMVTLNYILEEIPQDQEQGDGLFLLAAALVLAFAIILASVLLRNPQKSLPKEKAATMQVTSGKQEMMETFNENDKKIVDYLFSCNGSSKRNELERKTGISKSSLSKAINRLEKRKIIEIDRTSTTHFVKLSDFFLKL